MQWAAGFSLVSVRSVLILFSTLAARLTENVAMVACEELSLQRLVEPAVVDPEPAVFRTVEDIGEALPKTNGRIIVGPSRVDGLRRNNIVSGHNYHQRNVGCGEVFRS